MKRNDIFLFPHKRQKIGIEVGRMENIVIFECQTPRTIGSVDMRKQQTREACTEVIPCFLGKNCYWKIPLKVSLSVVLFEAQPSNHRNNGEHRHTAFL